MQRATSRAYPFQLTEDRHARLKREAAEAGLTMQAYLELKVFGEIRPRGPKGPRPYITDRNQKELPLTG